MTRAGFLEVTLKSGYVAELDAREAIRERGTVLISLVVAHELV